MLFRTDIKGNDITISRVGGGMIMTADIASLAQLTDSDVNDLCNALEYNAVPEAREIAARENNADESAYRYAEWREAVGY